MTWQKTENEVSSDTLVLSQEASTVLLYNDEEHTYHYVVEVLTKICKLNKTQAFRCAVEVDMTGRTIVYRGQREECEKVCEGITHYGPDHRLLHSMGSMHAEVQGGFGS